MTICMSFRTDRLYAGSHRKQKGEKVMCVNGCKIKSFADVTGGEVSYMKYIVCLCLKRRMTVSMAVCLCIFCLSFRCKNCIFPPNMPSYYSYNQLSF